MSHGSIRNAETGDKEAWKQQNRLSLAGTSGIALPQYLEKRPCVEELVFHLDNDEPGREASESLMKKYVDKGYSAWSELSTGKDWNDDLTVMIRRIRNEKARSREHSYCLSL